MPAPARVPLGATTTNRKWWLDVNTGTAEAPVWTGVHGITEFQDTLEGSLQADGDFDSNGWASQMNTENSWGIGIKVRRGVTEADPTDYDPGQEHLRAKARKVGVANVAHVRWYEMEEGGPRTEAHEGKVAVTYSPDGGAASALSTASITLAGRGEPEDITHPDAA